MAQLFSAGRAGLSRWQIGLAIAIIALAAWLPWRGAPQLGFAYDDVIAVEQNPRVHGLSHLGEIYRTEYWNRPELPSRLYRPFTLVSLAIEWQLLGGAPGHFHLTNLLVHALTSLLVALLAWLCLSGFAMRRREEDGESGAGGPGSDRAGAAYLGALAAGVLFALHPLHSEAILPIVGRAELRAGAYTVAALCALLLAGRRGRGWLLAAACFVFWALMSKESALLLIPFALALPVFFRRVGWGAVGLALAPSAVLFFAARAFVLRGIPEPKIAFADNPLVTAGLDQRVASAFAVIWRYVRLHVWPQRLVPDYSYDALPISNWSDPLTWLGLGSIVALCVAALLSLRSDSPARRLLGFGAAIWIVGLVAISNLFRVLGTMLGERLAYLPSIGFVLLVAGLVHLAMSVTSRGARRLAAAVLLAVAAVVAVGSFRVAAVRTRAWQSNLTLFQQATLDQPKSFRVWTGYGEALMNAGRLDEALPALQRSLQIYDGFGATHSCLMSIYHDRGDKERAKEHAYRLREIVPMDPKPYYLLADAYLGENELELARAEAEAGLAQDASYLPLQLVAGRVYRALGRDADAIACFERVIASRPELTAARVELGPLLVRGGRWEAAVQNYRIVWPAQQDWGSANYLAWSLLNWVRAGAPGDRAALLSEARAAAERSVALASPDLKRYPTDTLASVLFDSGERAQAVQLLEGLVRDHPEVADYRATLERYRAAAP